MASVPTSTEGKSRQRLIEKYFPSQGGVAERYSRGKTAHTIFTWWARRPFAAMRAVVASSLITSTGDDSKVYPVLEALCAEPDRLPLWDRIIESTEEEEPQRVLDLFAGGATIPLEAAALGAKAYAVDNNELANFVELALLKLSQFPNLARLVDTCGRNLLVRLKEETESFFPLRGGRKRAIAYYWSRSARCPGCKAALSLQKRPWLSKKAGKSTFIERVADPATKSYTKKLATSGEPSDLASAWDGNKIKCPFCGHVVTRGEIQTVIRDLGFDELTAYCLSPGRGKEYKLCERASDATPDEAYLQAEIQKDLSSCGTDLPTAELPQWSGVTNPTLYGFSKFSDLFSLRQLAVMVRLCRILRDEHSKWVTEHGSEIAQAIAAFLSGFVDQLADWNCRICMWIPQNEQVGRGLSGPGIPMMWDFVETDPVENGPANLWDKLDRIVSGLESIPKFEHAPDVHRADARNLPFPDQFFDVVATDPPYFDNIFYNVLADCVYVWKRLALGSVFPEVFGPESTDSNRELSASKYRHGSLKAAAQYYTEGMTQALSEAARVLKASGVLAFVFAHSTVDGWASVMEAFKQSKLAMVAAWEMQVERQHRPRGMNSNAVNTSFVLVGKKNTSAAVKTIQLPDVLLHLTDKLTSEKVRLSTLGWGDEDVALSLFGTAVCECSQYDDVRDELRPLTAMEILDAAAQIVETLVPGFTVSRR